jgi:tetratricopeptide (TPR) repeat protein
MKRQMLLARHGFKFMPLARRLVLLLLIVIATATNIANAVADDPWIGQRVFLKATARPKLGNRTMAWTDVTMPATVTQVNGDWLWVGNAWVRSGEVVKLDDAPTYYARILRQSPSNADAYLLRGLAWKMKRDYANAIKDFSEAIRLDPTSAVARQARAAVYHQVHEFDKALADLSEAIRLAPEVGMFYNDRGCVYKSLDNYPKAQEQFNEAIRIDPKLALAYSNRGVNWHVQKQYEKAMADFDKALAIDPKLTLAYAQRGYVWSKEGHYNQALRDWDEAIRLAPNEPWGYQNKARLYATCESVGHRDGQLALENAQKACELSYWEEWIFVATLAAAYAELGQFDEAIKWQKKAIAMNKNPEERDRIGQQERLNLYEAGLPFRDPEISQ